MQKLLTTIINYLYMGHSPTVLSFPDDGVTEIYDQLVRLTADPSGYDPTFLFCPLSFQYITDLSISGIESEIITSIRINSPKYADIIEVIKSGADLIVVADDLDLLPETDQAIASVDALIKKYRGKLRFVYLIEEPRILGRLKNSVFTNSSVLDAMIYHRIGENWDVDALARLCAAQYKQELTTDQIQEISRLSANHYGLFKHLYRDAVMHTKQTASYAEGLLNEFKMEELNTLKKLGSRHALTPAEEQIKQQYETVGLIRDNQVAIPLLAERLPDFRIRGKIRLNENQTKLEGLDLELLTKAERSIVEEMLAIGGEISKDEVAMLIWGQDAKENYSEWAIDQRMSRLKRKLKDLGFDIDIKTLYGRGYKIIQL